MLVTQVPSSNNDCHDPGYLTAMPMQHDLAGTLGNGSWGYTVGTYDKDAGTNNQRLYLNGARVAQMSDTLPIDLNSAALASDAM